MNRTTSMSAAEMRVVRDFLGLTTIWLSEHLDVAERTIHRWESGASPIPEGVRMSIERLEADAAHLVTASIEACLATATPRALTYRTDAEYQENHPDVSYPASWHRAIVARVAQEVPGLEIRYPMRAELRASPDDPIHARVLAYPWVAIEHEGVTYTPFGGHGTQGVLSSITYYPETFFTTKADDR